MRKNNTTSISNARTAKEIGEFWDTHSLADYWDQTREVKFEIKAKRKNRVTLDPDIAKAFRNEKAVNDALRLVLELNRVTKKRTAKA